MKMKDFDIDNYLKSQLQRKAAYNALKDSKVEETVQHIDVKSERTYLADQLESAGIKRFGNLIKRHCAAYRDADGVGRDMIAKVSKAKTRFPLT